jgi:Xaa-Pro aminopeptidase
LDLVVWEEGDDPIRMVADSMVGSRRVLIGDHTWSVFLLALQEASARKVSFEPASPVTKELRMRKDAAEVEALRAAAKGVDRVLSRLPQEVAFTGRTEAEVSAEIRRMTLEEDHQTAEFAIVGSGPNSASPHHEPGDRVIEPGDLVVCDFGGRHRGYFSDVTRTFVVGEPTAEHLDVHGAVLAANEAGRAAVRPGATCQEVDRAARAVIEDAGYGEWFVHRTGHGIGLEVHEHPYLVEGNKQVLEPGMTFSVEPGVYLPGRHGARVEDIVVCTEEGGESLNEAERGLVVVC